MAPLGGGGPHLWVGWVGWVKVPYVVESNQYVVESIESQLENGRLHVRLGHCLVMGGTLSCHGWDIVLSWVGHCF